MVLLIALLAAITALCPLALAQIATPSFNYSTAVNTTAPPVVTLHPATANGSAVTVTGARLFGYDSFLGIPFAQPPVGELRFARPQPAVYKGNVTAQRPPAACMQNPSGLDTPLGNFGMSEDCLQLNIIAPKGAVGGNASLPVMLWIYGGSFTGGSGSIYLSPFLVAQGESTNRPFLLVTINYRLGIFGWGYGKEMAENGAANLGLRDQILALQWVQENIAAFGGDPKKVTIFGQSAGAISVAMLMLNETTDLFRGAIMQSGGPSTAPIGPTAKTWQAPYDLLVNMTGCNPANVTAAAHANATGINGTTSPNTTAGSFNCLKSLPAAVVNNASTAIHNLPEYSLNFFWAPSVDGDLIKDAPSKLMANGSFARVPFITGNTKDEGTGFLGLPPLNLSTPGALNQFIDHLYPTPPNSTILAEVLKQYPNVPALGAPWGTGNETFGFDPQFKQATAIITDAAFQSRRRYMLRNANMHGWNQTWSYEFEGPTPGIPAWLGVPHSADVFYVFGIAMGPPLGNYTANATALSKTMMNYWINFAYYLNPNGNVTASASANATAANSNSTSTSNGTLYWPPHTFPVNKDSMRFIPSNSSVIQDDFRETRMAVFFRPEVMTALNMKRDGDV